METKTSRQCYDYYLIHHDKANSGRHMWTRDEETRLIDAVAVTNNRWAEIKRVYFPCFSIS